MSDIHNIQADLASPCIEAAAKALFEIGPGDYSWSEMAAEDPSRADIWREDARTVLAAADAVAEPSVEEFVNAVTAERKRQIAKGWTPEHDDEHGVRHLLHLAYDYVRRGEWVKAGALITAAHEVLERAEQSMEAVVRRHYATNRANPIAVHDDDAHEARVTGLLDDLRGAVPEPSAKPDRLAEAVATYRAAVKKASERQFSGAGAPEAILAGATLANAVDAILAEWPEPTEVEWEYGIKYGDEAVTTPPRPSASRERAEERLSAAHGDVLLRRTKSQIIPAGPWEKVPDE